MFGLFKVRGHSMSPNLCHGDVVMTKRRRGYQVGQVIVIRHHSLGMVVKRIQRVMPDGYVVAGDHPDSTDGAYLGRIAANQVAGVVILPRIND